MSFDLAGLGEAVARHGPVVRVVVAGSVGSSPRETGAAMLVWAGGQSGTIGGGALEFAAAARARDMLAGGGGPLLERHALGPGLGQCCGGAVTLVSEIWDAPGLAALGDPDLVARRVTTGAGEMPLALRRSLAAARATGGPVSPGLVGGWMLEPVSRPERQIWVWGAGHVGRAVVGVLAPLPGFALCWIDVDAARFPAGMPPGVTMLTAANPAELVAHAPTAAEHLILTYSHALDLELCHRLLLHGFAGLGLIGSATKAARFAGRLRALGHDPAAIARVQCPIGDPALGKHPQAIAVGVAVALLERRAGSRVADQERAG